MIIDIFERRTERLRGFLKKLHLDAMIVHAQGGFNWESVYYLCGFRGTAGTLIVYADSSELFVDSRYTLQAMEDAPHLLQDLNGAKPTDAAIASLVRRGAGAVGYEARKINHAAFSIFAARIPDLRDASALMSLLRREKDDMEIACLRTAASIAARALKQTLADASPGQSEREFAAALEYNLLSLGSEGSWGMGYMIASGERTAHPHGFSSDRCFKRGDWVTVDFGARYRGYVSDITRTFSFGSPPEIIAERLEILRSAHLAACGAIAPGVQAAVVDAAARSVVKSRGIENFFTHGTGHGIGLELHERPYISSDSSDVLQSGDVVTIEPGIYEPGVGGVRLEDDYLVAKIGRERLTSELPLEHFIL